MGHQKSVLRCAGALWELPGLFWAAGTTKSGSGKHQIWPEQGRAATIRADTLCARSHGPLEALNGQKPFKKRQRRPFSGFSASPPPGHGPWGLPLLIRCGSGVAALWECRRQFTLVGIEGPVDREVKHNLHLSEKGLKQVQLRRHVISATQGSHWLHWLYWFVL